MEMNENNYGLVKMQKVFFYQSSNNSSLVYAKSYFQIRFYPSNWSGFLLYYIRKRKHNFFTGKSHVFCLQSQSYVHSYIYLKNISITAVVLSLTSFCVYDNDSSRNQNNLVMYLASTTSWHHFVHLVISFENGKRQ